MFRRLIIVLLFLSISFATFAEDSTDYFLGVGAYKDGFYDVAKESLNNYLKQAKDKKKIIFAKYLLYKIYLKEKNYDKAYYYLREIKKSNDKRIDKNEIVSDEIFILSKKSCQDAKKLLLEHFNKHTLLVYLKTSCPVDDNISKKSLRIKLPDKIRLLLAVKLKKNPDEAARQFSKINLKHIKNEYKKSFAVYFYQNNKYDEFWKIYGTYKDSDLVNLALSRVWELKKYDSFVKSFEINKKKYKINKINYCRAFKAYEKLGKKADCGLLGSCFEKKDKDLIEAKLKCYLKNKDKKGLMNFINSIKKKHYDLVCKYAVDIIDVTEIQIDLFQKCPNVYDIAESLVSEENGNKLLKLLEDDNTDKGKYYKVIAYLLNEDIKSAEEELKTIKSKEIKDKLLKLFE